MTPVFHNSNHTHKSLIFSYIRLTEGVKWACSCLVFFLQYKLIVDINKYWNKLNISEHF